MYLPQNVLFCIEKLENEGYATYAVGGCVRDWLLGLTPHDYDLCTAATPEEMRMVFADLPLIRNGEKHGTVAVVVEHEPIEITAFRTEGNYSDSRHPDWVSFVRSIDQDLARRDFTVNAMAYSPTRGLRDPFEGQQDLKDRILRAVGQPEQRFAEDALRILRGLRFSVKYELRPEEKTLQAMFSQAPLMENLAKERIFEELCKFLPLAKAEDLTTFAPILTRVLPELSPCVGFLQHNPHHQYDVYTHTAQVVAAVPPMLPLRWAALLHDCGKPATFSLDESGVGHFIGHAQVSASLADSLLLRLKAPTALRKNVVTLIEQHMTPLTPDRKLLKRRASRLGVDTLRQLVALQLSDQGDAPQLDAVLEILAELEVENACLKITDLAVNGHDLLALGYEGRAIGQALEMLLQRVLNEEVENSRDALLELLHL